MVSCASARTRNATLLGGTMQTGTPISCSIRGVARLGSTRLRCRLSEGVCHGLTDAHRLPTLPGRSPLRRPVRRRAASRYPLAIARSEASGCADMESHNACAAPASSAARPSCPSAVLSTEMACSSSAIPNRSPSCRKPRKLARNRRLAAGRSPRRVRRIRRIRLSGRRTGYPRGPGSPATPLRAASGIEPDRGVAALT